MFTKSPGYPSRAALTNAYRRTAGYGAATRRAPEHGRRRTMISDCGRPWMDRRRMRQSYQECPLVLYKISALDPKRPLLRVACRAMQTMDEVVKSIDGKVVVD